MTSTKLSKFKHACFVVDKNGRSLIVDPGSWSDDFVCPAGVDAIIITHEHADHCDKINLSDIIASNPDAIIYTHADIAKQLDDLPTYAVEVGSKVEAGEFLLEFFGDQHAVIHPDIPLVANLGVMIDDKIYYPGDSFVGPGRSVEWLALPVSAPWMKISEAIDFAHSIDATHVFPTHDAILSDIGKVWLIDKVKV